MATEEYTLRAMASNYGDGPHSWDFLDKEACQRAADEIRGLLARATAAEARVAQLETALKPFSVAAGGLFTRNFCSADVVVMEALSDGHAEVLVTAGDFFKARTALSQSPDREGGTNKHDAP